jgi:protein-tyrosine phosphatase
MIDLHCHILPEVDDGARNLATALDMARMAVDDGITVIACTPHSLPGVYDIDAKDIRHRVYCLNQQLTERGIDLVLVPGCDAHVRPDFVACLREGRILTLNDTRYVLVEPPHNVMPRRLDNLLFEIVLAGYVPILTHPERLAWLPANVKALEEMVRSGTWLQVTAGSLCGNFGRKAKYWAQHLLAQGMVHIFASDAHNVDARPPCLSQARKIVEMEVGASEAARLFLTRPQQILEDVPVVQTASVKISSPSPPQPVSFWRRLVRGASV